MGELHNNTTKYHISSNYNFFRLDCISYMHTEQIAALFQLYAQYCLLWFKLATCLVIQCLNRTEHVMKHVIWGIKHTFYRIFYNIPLFRRGIKEWIHAEKKSAHRVHHINQRSIKKCNESKLISLHLLPNSPCCIKTCLIGWYTPRLIIQPNSI